MKVAIFAHRINEEFTSLIKPFLEKLAHHGVSPIWESSMATELIAQNILPNNHLEVFNFESGLEEAELFFSFGGDGTVLTSITYVQDKEIPIIGVNLGRLGFLAYFHQTDLLPQLESLLKKEFSISHRNLLDVSLTHQSLEFPFAINEIAISRKETTSMITVDTYLDGEFLNSFWADGLIVSTPTGSTGYSLSCGGPIISPENQNFVITPIAPHNLNVRPFVIPNHSEIKLKVHSRVPHYSLSLDSRLISLNLEEEIILKKSKITAHIVQNKNNNYLTTLRQKLLWGKDSRN